MPTTKPYAGCGKLTIGDISGRHHLCRTCNNERRHPSGPVEASPAILPPPPPPPSPPLFDRTNARLSPLNDHQRYSIITFYKEK